MLQGAHSRLSTPQATQQVIPDSRGAWSAWQRCAGSGSLIAEPFVEIGYGISGRSFYDLQDLPPVTIACAFCSHDDAAAEDAYCAINKWMSVRGLSLASPKRELYLGDMEFPSGSFQMRRASGPIL